MSDECMQYRDHCGNCQLRIAGGWTDEDVELAALGVVILCGDCADELEATGELS